MKEILYEEVTETKQKEIGHTSICNRCGKKNEVKNGNYHLDNIKGFYLDFGYESQFDGEYWSFDLCEDCMLEIIKQFKFVPQGFMQDKYMELDKEEHQKVFDNWKSTGEWEELKFKTYDELVEMNNGWINTEYINDTIKKFHPVKPLLEEVED